MENFPEKIPERIRFSLRKEERLRSKKQIEKLFAEGSTFLVYPLKVVYSEIEPSGFFSAKVVFAISSRIFKKAVLRNLARRRMREAYRLNKHLMSSERKKPVLGIVFIYVGKKILDFQVIEKAMKRSLSILAKHPAPNP